MASSDDCYVNPALLCFMLQPRRNLVSVPAEVERQLETRNEPVHESGVAHNLRHKGFARAAANLLELDSAAIGALDGVLAHSLTGGARATHHKGNEMHEHEPCLCPRFYARRGHDRFDIVEEFLA
jgi:D-serine deaminase-like pyridoxal phosphate-dependent protein